jgi:hypothetical protein
LLRSPELLSSHTNGARVPPVPLTAFGMPTSLPSTLLQASVGALSNVTGEIVGGLAVGVNVGEIDGGAMHLIPL